VSRWSKAEDERESIYKVESESLRGGQFKFGTIFLSIKVR